MKEIEEAFKRVWNALIVIHSYDSLDDTISEAESLVRSTIQNLRKENFELYKALHGVKHPEDV